MMNIVHIGMELPLLITPNDLAQPELLPRHLLDHGAFARTYALGETVDITPEVWKADGLMYVLKIDETDPVRATVTSLNEHEVFLSNVSGEKIEGGNQIHRLPEDLDMLPLVRVDPVARLMALGALIFRGQVSPLGVVSVMAGHEK